MNTQETEKFQRVGGFFWLLFLGVTIALPIVGALILTIAHSGFEMYIFASFACVFAFIIWMVVALLIGYGKFTSVFVNQTAKGISSLPYHFNSSFTGRSGKLYIDVENGMIGFISAYNPKVIQIFNANRVEKPKTLASMMTGVRFVFYLDGKKVTMYTLLSNRMVNLKSGIGAEAVSKADAFVELLLAAKNSAAMRTAR